MKFNTLKNSASKFVDVFTILWDIPFKLLAKYVQMI